MGYWRRALEFGERLVDAVRREIKEELLADAKEIKFLKSYEALRDNDGTPTHWMAFIHSVLVEPSVINIGEPQKIDEIGWFCKDDLPEPMHSMFHHALECALQHGLLK